MVTAPKEAVPTCSFGSSRPGSKSRRSGRDSKSSEDAESENSQDIFANLTFGEQLVLETYHHSVQRPYDKKRQEELATPRGRTGDANCSSAVPEQPLHKGFMDSSRLLEMIARLSQPRRPTSSSAAEAAAPKATEDLQPKRRVLDLEASLQRLTSPRSKAKALQHGGAQIIMLQNMEHARRQVDFERLTAMARPKKTGTFRFRPGASNLFAIIPSSSTGSA